MAALTICKNDNYCERYMSFNDLLEEVIKLKAAGKKTEILSEKEQKKIYSTKNITDKKPNIDTSIIKPLTVYRLGSKHGTVYFTRREAECMILLLKGKTINSVATILNLSPRTVEYYVKNMKSKLGCKTKFELVDLVHASDFIKGIDF